MQLSLMDPTPTVAEIQTRKGRWLSALRAQFLLHYRGEVVSADHVWLLMEHCPALRIPDGMSSNVLGTFFSGWKHAEPVGWTRSKREGANANVLRTWRVGVSLFSQESRVSAMNDASERDTP